MKYKVIPSCQTFDGIEIICSPLEIEAETAGEAFYWGLKSAKYWFPEESFQEHTCKVEEVIDDTKTGTSN